MSATAFSNVVRCGNKGEIIMVINFKMLKNACRGGRIYFRKHWGEDGTPDHLEVLEQINKDRVPDYNTWIFEKLKLSGRCPVWNSLNKFSYNNYYKRGKMMRHNCHYIDWS